MPNKRSGNKNHGARPPFNDFDLDLGAGRLFDDTPHHKQASLIEKIEVRPGEQRRISLGSFARRKPPSGFSIELSPDPFPEGSILTEVTSLGTSERYKLVLHIANYGTKAVTAEVWQL